MSEFEWDPRKARDNAAKHGVSFVQAATVFVDELAVQWDLEVSVDDEDRYLIVGRSSRGQLLLVVYAYDDGTIRIISARRLTASERRRYEEGA